MTTRIPKCFRTLTWLLGYQSVLKRFHDYKDQGSKLPDAKCVCFFHIGSENWHVNDKKMRVHISASVQKLCLSTFVLFRNVCFLFLILESILKRSLFISYAAGGYNSTGLSVSLVLNHRSFVQDWKPVVRI